MRIQGITFAGTGTAARPQMTAFARDVLGMRQVQVASVEADLFDLPDGSSFAVASAGGMGATQRSIGFLVDDIDAAVQELRDAGADVDDEVSFKARERYVHFRAPDGQLYELVERKPAADAAVRGDGASRLAATGDGRSPARPDPA
jgi:glyoxylase I family protein